MTIEDIQSICNKLPGVTQDIKWEDYLCFNVAEKMFLITSPDSVPVTASFKVGEEEFEEISSREGVRPAPYLARYKWVFAKNMTDKFQYPYSESNGRQFIAFATKDNPIHIFAIEVNGEAVGGIGIHPQEYIQAKNAELGYWLAEPFLGKGIITNAVLQMVEFSFNTFDINRIFARPFGTNMASKRVLEKA